VNNKPAIRAFLTRRREYLAGRVLDFGCGRQLYRDLVVGEYHGYDPNPLGRTDYPEALVPPHGAYDAILITQVLQAVDNPFEEIGRVRKFLKYGGHWVVTYNANWREVEPQDKWRFTRTGMEALLGGSPVVHEAIFSAPPFILTYGIVSRWS
jgi:hypothetical protein